MKKQKTFGILTVLLLVFFQFPGCKTAAIVHAEEKKQESLLKYPVILAHGIMAHDRKSMIDFWGNIPVRFMENNIIVYFGNTDAWGDYESNAAILKETIDRVLSETKSEKVNIISHSKGGLDSRYMIWKYDYGDKIASLTTICTPHHGAEISDLIHQRRIVHTRMAKRLADVFGKLYGDANPNLYNLRCWLPG